MYDITVYCATLRHLETNEDPRRLYREDVYFVDRFHGDWCSADCEAHTNFADESACMTADNFQNEGKFLPLFTDNRRC
jgi:hypothetical protein